eukprot:3119839-Pyramimonas_sp.AAC.1
MLYSSPPALRALSKMPLFSMDLVRFDKALTITRQQVQNRTKHLTWLVGGAGGVWGRRPVPWQRRPDETAGGRMRQLAGERDSWRANETAGGQMRQLAGE